MLVNGVPVTGTDAPPVGSVFDTYTVGDSGYANIYSAIPTGGGNYEITDTVVTPQGDYTVPPRLTRPTLPPPTRGVYRSGPATSSILLAPRRLTR